MNEVLRQWLTGTVVPGLEAVLAVAAIALLREWARRLKDERARRALMALVEAAEQLYGPGKGEAKRRYVRERMKQKGLQQLSREDLEATVYGLNKK